MDHVQFDRLPDDALIRLNSLIAWGIIPFSASTLWRKCKSGDFPSPVKVSDHVTAWRVGQLRAFLQDPANYKSRVSQSKRRGA